MQKKNNILIALLIVILIIIVCIKFKPKNAVAPVNEQTVITSDADYQLNTSKQDLRITQATNLFHTWIAKEGSTTGHALTDYKIDDVTFFADKATILAPDQFDYFPTQTTKDAYIVNIVYSVKPADLNDNWWIAGNGTRESNGWIARKSLFVTIDKKDSEYVIINMGTGL